MRLEQREWQATRWRVADAMAIVSAAADRMSESVAAELWRAEVEQEWRWFDWSAWLLQRTDRSNP